MAGLDLNDVLAQIPDVSIRTSETAGTTAGKSVAITPLFDDKETRALADEYVTKGKKAQEAIIKQKDAIGDVLEKTEAGQKLVAEFNADAETYKAKKALELQSWGQELAAKMDLTEVITDLSVQHAEESKELIDLQNRADELRKVGISDGFFDWFSAQWQLGDVEQALGEKNSNLQSLESRIQNVDRNMTAAKSAQQHTQSLISEEFVARIDEVHAAKYEVERAARMKERGEYNIKAIVDMRNAATEEFKALTSARTATVQERLARQEGTRQALEQQTHANIAKVVNLARERLGQPLISTVEVASSLKLPNSAAYVNLQSEFSHGYELGRMLIGDESSLPDIPLAPTYASAVEVSRVSAKDARFSNNTNLKRGSDLVIKRAIQTASQQTPPVDFRNADPATQASYMNQTAAAISEQHHKDISEDGENNFYKAQPLATLVNYSNVEGTELYREVLKNLPQDKPIDEQQIVDLGVARVLAGG